MKVTIRLHRQHDMDLISVYKNSSFQLAKEAKRALLAYASGQAYTMPEPNWDDAEYGYVPGSMVFRITLNPNKPAEAQAIALMDSLHQGFRCSFMKALIRNSLPYIALMPYGGANSGYVMSAKEWQKTGAQMVVKSDVIKTKSQKEKEAAREAARAQTKALEQTITKAPVQQPVVNQMPAAQRIPVVQPAVQRVPILNPNVVLQQPAPQPVAPQPVVVETPVQEPEPVVEEPVAIEEPIPAAEPSDDLDLDALFMQMGSLAHQ